MGKSVYSIVLSDEVVRAVDDMAYRNGTSRSNLINQILAERVSYVTPEMRMREIFSMVEAALDSGFLPSPQTSDSVLAVKRALRFKYKPTMKYSVELSRKFSGQVAKLRVSLRTRSSELIMLSVGFFRCWSALEQKYCGKYFSGGFPCEITQSGYERDFYEIGSGELDNNEIAEAITDYIRVFDRAMSLWFENGGASAEGLCEEIYKGYISGKTERMV